MREPQTETERAVFDLWTELRPDEAFIQGVDGCAGRFFVPTPARVRRILDRIARTQQSTEDPTERKLLASFRARIELREPAVLPEALVESLFGYMVKEGVNPEHIRGLAAEGRRALDVRRAQSRGRTPAGMRALVQLACNGLSQILETVDSQLREPKARADVRRDVRAVPEDRGGPRPIAVLRTRPAGPLGLRRDAGGGGGRGPPDA